jgi:hypothetical protein
MTASTITETTALHGRNRLRAREETAEVLPKHSPLAFKHGGNGHDAVQTPCHSIIQESKNHLLNLYSSSAEAKIWGVAAKGLRQPSPPTLFPEYTKPGDVDYIYRELDFWTSGFFPGSLHLLLDRRRKYAHLLRPSDEPTRGFPHLLNLE